jgi:hypothetical protein
LRNRFECFGLDFLFGRIQSLKKFVFFCFFSSHQLVSVDSCFGVFGGLGVVGGHCVEVTKVKKRRLSVIRRAVTARAFDFTCFSL